MSSEYLSFKDFNEKDLNEFIGSYPQELLAKPIAASKKAYKNEKGIKGFRPESYKMSTLKRIYSKEILKMGEKSFLGCYILDGFDRELQKMITSDEYKLLVEKKCADEQLEKILGKINKKSNGKKRFEYIIKLLGMDQEKINRYKEILFNEKLENKNKEIEKLNNELIKLKDDNNDIKEKFDNLNKKYEAIIEENNCLDETVKKIKEENNSIRKSIKVVDKDEIIEEFFKGIKNIDSKNLVEINNHLNLVDKSNYIDILYKEKSNDFNNGNYKNVINYIFIEYMITIMKELENNGQI